MTHEERFQGLWRKAEEKVCEAPEWGGGRSVRHLGLIIDLCHIVQRLITLAL